MIMTVLLDSINFVCYEDNDRSHKFSFDESQNRHNVATRRRLPPNFSKQDSNEFTPTINNHCLSEGDFLNDENEPKSSDESHSRYSDCSDLSIPDDELTNLSFSSGETSNDISFKLNEVVITTPSTPLCSVEPICSVEPMCSVRCKSSTEAEKERSYLTLRITYLLITLVVMLADGLQGRFRPVRMTART
jgi:predicted nucleic acid-binding Zn ribbon protein